MSWYLLLLLTLIVFFNRYVFLEPKLPIRMPRLVNDALKYSAPCLLTAICGPVILLNHGVVRDFSENPYLWGAILSVAIAYYCRNMLIAVLLSLAGFYFIRFFG